jgi:hypothetical protein
MLERQPGLRGAMGDLGLGEREECCVQPSAGRFPTTVKMDLKIAAVITAAGLGVPGGLAVAGVGAAAAPVGLG